LRRCPQLVDNAAKYTFRRLRTLALERRENVAVFEVSDTGIGIPPAEQKDLTALQS
jgi:signal transduction histidine kinase